MNVGTGHGARILDLPPTEPKQCAIRIEVTVVDFSGKIAIVTGGALGMGAATAHGFARSGSAVVVADIEQTLARYGSGHPIGRIGQGGDIAALVLFLASDAASFMTGTHVVVDGCLMAIGAWAGGAGAPATDD